MELEIETRLSQRPRLQPNDLTALTASQQRSLNTHKVGLQQLLSQAKRNYLRVAALERFCCHGNDVLVCMVCYLLWQVETRIKNEQYLRDHPELIEMMTTFVRQCQQLLLINCFGGLSMLFLHTVLCQFTNQNISKSLQQVRRTTHVFE